MKIMNENGKTDKQKRSTKKGLIKMSKKNKIGTKKRIEVINLIQLRLFLISKLKFFKA